MPKHFSFSKFTRRDLLRAGMYGVGVTAGALPLPLFAQAGAALAAQGKHDGKILVVLELSGGNDGLNTLMPYGDDAYYQASAAYRHPQEGTAADRRPLRFQRGHGRVRTPI